MNRQSNKITAIYVRIDYPGDSEYIQMQIDTLRRYAEEKCLSNTQIYSDNGYSGTASARPAFQRLLADIEHGKITNLIVHSVGKLYRNYMNGSQFVDEHLPAHGVALYALQDEITPRLPQHPFYKCLPDAMGGGQ